MALASRGEQLYALSRADGLFVGYMLEVPVDYAVDFVVDVPLRVVGYQREPARADVRVAAARHCDELVHVRVEAVALGVHFLQRFQRLIRLRVVP